MPREKGENEVQEVEVERLEPGEAESRPPEPGPRKGTGQVARALGPIVAGLLVDAIDAATLNPLLGLGLGFPLGLFIAHQLGMRNGAAWQLAVVIALYAAAPGTSRFPLGTLVGIYTRLRGGLKNGSPS